MSGTKENNDFKRLANLFTDKSSPDHINQSHLLKHKNRCESLYNLKR